MQTSATSGSFGEPGIPDMRFINKKIGIFEVARKLDLRTEGHNKIHCWHPERHQNGDRTASVAVRKTNNTVKCFGCAAATPIGPIDLVMDVKGLSNVTDAAHWIADNFDVPKIPKGRHLGIKEVRPRAGYEGAFGLLIRSGLWARLSAPARAIAPVLYEFSEEETLCLRTVQISYAAITRYSGIRSPNAIHQAITELAELSWLTLPEKVHPIQRLHCPASTYVLTTHSEALNSIAQDATRQNKEEVEAERVMRREQTQKRRFQLAIHSACQTAEKAA